MASPNSNEATTRAQLVDAQLAHAGWNKSRRSLIEEFVLSAQENEAGYNAQQFADYVLLGSDGKPLAVVEAKRTSRDELAGKRQAADYADLIKAKFGQDPFIFLTNGKEIQFWDRERYAPRKVSGFYTRDDLERLHHQRKFAQPLQGVAINADIAGRDYQNEAIRRVTEGVDAAKRKFLLVMATGTGKTRTTIALVDTLLRAKRVQRVLFLADRRELVRQAMSEFKSHLPNESLARIEAGETSGARIQFSTYPSMMQVYSRLSVGYYDLIVADESHRSIYQRYKAVFDHFDSIQLGLTATPTDYIDHNTFELFDCGDGAPSYYYSYEQAIADQNLVNYRVLDAQTNFQLKGIQGDVLIRLRRAPVPSDTDLPEIDDIGVLRYEELSDGEQMVLGRMALFHLLQGQQDALLLLDEPETHFNDKWKREIVDIIDDAIGHTSNDVLISTHSAIVLSDVFNNEIVMVQKTAHGSDVRSVDEPTFGTDPSALMMTVFGADDSIGKRAQEFIEGKLRQTIGTEAEIADLERLIARMGSGFCRDRRSQLRRRDRLGDQGRQDQARLIHGQSVP
ncbi:MAG: DEAD/DEAH box helicase family protein [Methylibium sp.]